MTGTSKKIDFRSLCYGVDKHMDSPEPTYIFPNRVVYVPMKRNRVSGSERNQDKEQSR